MPESMQYKIINLLTCSAIRYALVDFQLVRGALAHLFCEKAYNEDRAEMEFYLNQCNAFLEPDEG